MEGGCLAIQDSKYINLNDPTFGVTGNTKVWDKNDNLRFGWTSNPEIFLNNTWLPLPDPIYKDPDYLKSSLNIERKGDLLADKVISERYNLKIKYVDDILNEKFGVDNWKYNNTKETEIVLENGEVISIGYSPISEPRRPYGIPQDALTRVTVKWDDGVIETERLSNTLLVEGWSYEGLNVLKETDFLKVYEPDTREVICEGQINQIPLIVFSQTRKGHFKHINRNNDNISNWEKYFDERYLAELHREEKLEPTRNIANGGKSANSSILSRIKHFFGG